MQIHVRCIFLAAKKKSTGEVIEGLNLLVSGKIIRQLHEEERDIFELYIKNNFDVITKEVLGILGKHWERTRVENRTGATGTRN